MSISGKELVLVFDAFFDQQLKKQIGRIYTNFELSASVGKLRSIQGFVVGQARNPGAYMVSSLSTLVGAGFESGGPTTSGSMRRVELMRAGTRVASIDMYQFIQSGHVAADARLLPGDVIVFPPAGPRVGLTGALDNPFIFELAGKEDSIEQVLKYSASPTTLTTPHKVLVERVDNRQTQGPREVQERMLAAGVYVNYLNANDATKKINNEVAMWAKVIKDANIKAD
jgi:hypothetical protein